jgi:hypothetical protein
MLYMYRSLYLDSRGLAACLGGLRVSTYQFSLDVHLVSALSFPLAVVKPLLRCCLCVLHPLVVSPIFHLGSRNTLHGLANEPDKVVSSQSVLPPPLSPLPLLALQHLLVSDRFCLCPQILAHGQQVESDLGLGVSCDSRLQYRHDCVCEDLTRACADVAVSDRRWLQTVDLVECAVDRGIGDEVVDVVVFGCYSGLVAYEW